MSNVTRIVRRRAYVEDCPPIFNRGMGEHEETAGRNGTHRVYPRLSGKFARAAGHPGTLVRRSKVEAEPKRFKPRVASTNTERHSFHVWSIANGLRSKLFQLAMRNASHLMGLDEGSSDMHHLHGLTL